LVESVWLQRLTYCRTQIILRTYQRLTSYLTTIRSPEVWRSTSWLLLVGTKALLSGCVYTCKLAKINSQSLRHDKQRLCFLYIELSLQAMWCRCQESKWYCRERTYTSFVCTKNVCRRRLSCNLAMLLEKSYPCGAAFADLAETRSQNSLNLLIVNTLVRTYPLLRDQV
jgi:hypothetical protein